MRDLEVVSLTEKGNGDFTLRSGALARQMSKGRITSLYDTLRGCGVLAEVRTAGLVICEDYPNQSHAWDADILSLNTFEPIHFDCIRVTERGFWRAGLELKANFDKRCA